MAKYYRGNCLPLHAANDQDGHEGHMEMDIKSELIKMQNNC